MAHEIAHVLHGSTLDTPALVDLFLARGSEIQDAGFDTMEDSAAALETFRGSTEVEALRSELR